MKNVSHPKYFILLLLLSVGLVSGALLRAQEPPPAPVAPDEQKVAPAEAPKPPEAAPAEPKPDEQVAAADEPEQETVAESEQKAGDEQSDTADEPRRHRRRHDGNSERVSFGNDSTLGAGETADAVVSIFGSSTSAGEVSDAVVSVIGSSRVTGGTVGDSAVSVLGSTYVNGHVKGEVVAVLGNVELGPDAVVDGEVVCIGGEIKRDPKAVHHGNVQNIAIAGHHFDFENLTTWFSKCLLYARPLAFDRHLWWAWTIALAFLGFYALIALIAAPGVNKCVETLEERPGSSLLAALLTLLLTPVVYILLALTLAIAVGFVLIPTFSLGLFFAAIFGKVVMLTWLGRRFAKLAGEGPWTHPFFCVLIGGALVLLIYTVPIVGFITYKLLGVLGLGVVVYSLIRQFKASRPPKPAPVAVVAPAGAMAAMPVVAGGEVPPPVGPVPPSAAPAVISAATLPRAGFWIRVCAAFLDFILVFVALTILFHGVLNFHGGPGPIFLLWIAYHPIMWKLKGTTIGGIICSLKVVRLDDRPLDWGVAIVRALTAFLSFIACGLGFIWVAFDDERQSWHDKVAGTTIVRVPRGMSLL